MRSDFGCQFFLWLKTGHPFLDLAAFEEHQGGDAHYSILHHDVRVLVSIQFNNLDLAFPLASKLLDDWFDHFARLTPGRSEIHQNWQVSANYFFLKI